MKHAVGALACVLKFFGDRFKAAKDDTRVMGRDAMRAGAALMFVNIYNGTLLGFACGFVALVLGFFIWALSLPAPEGSKHHKVRRRS